MELPIFDLAAIANATNNFSNNMKLGEGGFGLVYKVNNNINRRAIFFIFRATSCIALLFKHTLYNSICLLLLKRHRAIRRHHFYSG